MWHGRVCAVSLSALVAVCWRRVAPCNPRCSVCVADWACRYKPVIIQHCLHVYGRRAAQNPAAGADAAAASSCSSSSDGYVLDERQVCLHYARKLLRQRAVWPLHAFLPAWEQEVPGGCWSPQEEMLAGEALVLQPDPLEGVTVQLVRRLSKQQWW